MKLLPEICETTLHAQRVAEYEEKKRARIERLKARAENAHAESDNLYQQASKMASIIPMGQPILIGHYSEGRDRRYRAKIETKFHRSHEASQKAEHYERRAEAAESNAAISSDDPDAVRKLKAEIAGLENKQAKMVAVNKCVRKNDREGLRAMGLSEAVINEHFTPDCFGGLGFAQYELSNNSANIRRLKKRVEYLSKLQAVPTKEVQWGSVRVVDNAELNRLQLFFPGKPAENIRTELKRSGFRWSPTEGAWQAYRGNRAQSEAARIVRMHETLAA